MALRKDITVEYLNNGGRDVLPGALGLEILTLEEGKLTSRMEITKKHLAINGFLHAASVIAIADTIRETGWFPKPFRCLKITLSTV